MKDDDQRGSRREVWLVAALAACASLTAFLYYFFRGEILLYGDAVAHINIARRVMDSREPGLAQLGTVWLPFPHLVQIPFLITDWLWKTGVGSSIPSMIAYILGVVGIFRLLRARTTLFTAWAGAAIFAFNPSLLYMQSTAMTESIFLASMVWSVFYADEFRRALFPPGYGYGHTASLPAWRALERCGMSLFVAIFTRYDGWIFAFAVGVVNLVIFAKWYRDGNSDAALRRLTRSMASFLLLCALAPTLWLAHNYYLSKHPLDWYNGPYSAKAIEARSSQPGAPPYPGKGSMKVAAQYFMRSARLNMSEGHTAGWIVAVALLGTIVAALHLGQFGSLLLFWIPLPFYAYSVAFGSVPIFIPEWWPYSYYNVRYGLELLPMFAVMLALSVWALSGVRVKKVGAIVSALLVVLIGYGYRSSWKGDTAYAWGVHAPWPGPVCYREGLVNSRTRLGVEHWLAAQLQQVPAQAHVLMYTSEYVGALQLADIHLVRVVNESTQLAWEAGLSSPAAVAEYVVTIGDDPVAKAVAFNHSGLILIDQRVSENGPRIAIYRSQLRR